MQKAPLSIRIIYKVTSLLYFISIFATGMLILMALAMLTGLTDDVLLSVQIPEKIENTEVQSLSVMGENMKVKPVENRTTYQFIDNPSKVRNLYAISILIFYPLLFWLVFLFYRFIKNVRNGKLYDIKNLMLLRNLGYGILGFWALNIVYDKILKLLVSQELKFVGISFSSDGSGWYQQTLLIALFVLTLSHVFSKGIDLKEENKLTI